MYPDVRENKLVNVGPIIWILHWKKHRSPKQKTCFWKNCTVNLVTNGSRFRIECPAEVITKSKINSIRCTIVWVFKSHHLQNNQRESGRRRKLGRTRRNQWNQKKLLQVFPVPHCPSQQCPPLPPLRPHPPHPPLPPLPPRPPVIMLVPIEQAINLLIRFWVHYCHLCYCPQFTLHLYPQILRHAVPIPVTIVVVVVHIPLKYERAVWCNTSDAFDVDVGAQW